MKIDMNYFYFVISGFVIAFVLYMLPAFRFFLYARKSNVEISLLQSFMMRRKGSVEKSLVDNCLIWQSYKSDINIVELETFYCANVDLNEITNGLLLGSEMDLRLCPVKLAELSVLGHDVFSCIYSLKGKRSIELCFEHKDLVVDVSLMYKNNLSIGFSTKDEKEKVLKESLQKCIEDHSGHDEDMLQQILKMECLNSKFWRLKIKSELVESRLLINRRAMALVD